MAMRALRTMRELFGLALLIAAAALSCLSFAALVAHKQTKNIWEKATTTVGVTAFLSAVGLVLERNGIAAAALLLLFSWLVYDTSERQGLSRQLHIPLAWLSMTLLFVFIASARR